MLMFRKVREFWQNMRSLRDDRFRAYKGDAELAGKTSQSSLISAEFAKLAGRYFLGTLGRRGICGEGFGNFVNLRCLRDDSFKAHKGDAEFAGELAEYAKFAKNG